MYLLFTAMRFFPWWALPASVVIVELGIFYRRKASKAQFVCFGFAGLLVLCSLLWLIFRGDLNSDAWLQALFGASGA